jgi:hypothetical protein
MIIDIVDSKPECSLQAFSYKKGFFVKNKYNLSLKIILYRTRTLQLIMLIKTKIIYNRWLRVARLIKHGHREKVLACAN